LPLPPPAPRFRWRIPALTLGVLFALALTGLAALGMVQIGRKLWEAPEDAAPIRQSVAVLDFRSLSPNSKLEWMETALAEMLTTELAAGGKLRVIRGERVAQAVKSLKLRDPRRLGREDLEKLHEALGADLVVVGTFTPLHDQIRVDLRVLKLPGGDIKTSLARVGTQPALFELVSGTGVSLRKALGVEALSPEQVQQAQALRPGNPDAERLYHEGLARLRAFDAPGALSFLQRAAKADPSSAVIHTGLSRAWSVLGYDPRAAEEARKAVELSKSLSKEEQLATQARFHQVSKDWEQASQTYRALWTFYPDDVEYGLQLADCLMMGGFGAEAAVTIAALRRLPRPAGEDPRIDLLEARNARRLYDFATAMRAGDAAAEKGRRSGQALIVSQARISQGDALLQMGKPREAMVLFQEAKTLAEGSGYQWGVGRALANTATAMQALGDLAGAEKANREALEIAQRLGSGMGIAAQFYILGGLAQERGDLDEALALLDKAFQWYVDLGDRVMQARVLNAAGTVLTSRGDLMEARARLKKALALTHALNHRAYEARTLDNLGIALAFQGRLGEARSHHEEAFTILSQLNDPSSAATALLGAAEAQARLGNLAGAWERSAKALETKRKIDDRIGIARVLGLRSRLAWWRGDLAAARSLAEEQRGIAEETGAKPQAASALQNLGRAAYAAGDLDEARRFLERALETSLAVGESLRASEVRLDLAVIVLGLGDFNQASMLAQEAAAWYRARNIPGGEARGLTILAESLAGSRGLTGPAREAAAYARTRLAATEDRPLRLHLAVRLARLEAAAGHKAEAARQLTRTNADAMRMGLVSAGLEARLALGEVQRSLRDPQAAATLEAVRRDAEARGFKRLASLAGEPVSDPMIVKVAR
ncbi:MAG TPA: tetratricopeptide repeat protein, partial [Thermoanaerobaculia bacterium]|nr:tetratricopeptide repeat protein [Thermoanaerobaculia bacterium]